VGCGDAVDAGVAAGDDDGDGDGDACGEATGVGSVFCSGAVDCKTELVPVILGSDNINAININAAAAPIVIFARSV
jgi:hypothetical protein